MAQTEGPCSRAKAWAKLSGSALRMKLTSPCLYSVTFFERCRAAATNPICSNSARNCCGSGPVYSTNSNPSVPIGLSHKSCGAGLSLIAGLRKRLAPMWSRVLALPRARRGARRLSPIGGDWRGLAAFAADLQPAPPTLSCQPIRVLAASARNLQAITPPIVTVFRSVLLLMQRICSKVATLARDRPGRDRNGNRPGTYQGSRLRRNSSARAPPPRNLRPARMRTGALWEQQNTGQDQCGDDRRSERTAQGKPAMADRLVEEIADRRAEWPGQDEGGPEQQNARHRGP